MNKNQKLSTIACGLLTGAILLTGGIVNAASASTSASNVETKQGRPMIKYEKMAENKFSMQDELKSVFTEMVKEGSITQAKSDAFFTYLTTKEAEMKVNMKANMKAQKTSDSTTKQQPVKGDKKASFLSLAVTDKVLTSEQVTIIETKLEAKRVAEQKAREAEQKTKMTTELANLVTAKTITQAQSDAIVAALDKEQSDRKAEMEKVKAMTETERAEYMKTAQVEHKNALADLVTANTITQEQADAVGKIIGHGFKNDGPMGKNKRMGENKVPMQDNLKGVLSEMVTQSSITQAQSDAIVAALDKEQSDRKAEMEKVKAMTETERAEYMKTVKVEHKNALADLVTANTITQAQSDAVAKVIGHGFNHR